MSSAGQQQNGFSRRSKSFHVERRPRQASIARRTVVAIKGQSSSAKAEDLCEDKLLPGDIVEQVNVGGFALKAPFAGGKAGLQRELRRLFNIGETQAQVQVTRSAGKIAELQASIVPDDSVMLKKQYVLRDFQDPNHVVTITDSTEEECLALQESRCARVVSYLANAQLKDAYVHYAWEEKMQKLLPVQTSSMVFSLVVVPYAPDRAVPLYNDLEDTVARAMTWFSAAQASGVPVNFLNIQTEPLLTKVSGQQDSSRTVSSGSREGLASIINTGIYGFEDYHGIDIGVVRAVRLWYVPLVAEIAIILQPEEGESRLGVGIRRTDEGFCYVSSVDDGTVADRAGLKTVLQAAESAGKLLVISRVAEEKVTPSMVSSSGSIRCFDTHSISQKLSMHRQACQPVRIHFMVWDGAVLARGWESSTSNTAASSQRHQESTLANNQAKRLANSLASKHGASMGAAEVIESEGELIVSMESSSASSSSRGGAGGSQSLEWSPASSRGGGGRHSLDRSSLGEFSFRNGHFRSEEDEDDENDEFLLRT